MYYNPLSKSRKIKQTINNGVFIATTVVSVYSIYDLGVSIIDEISDRRAERKIQEAEGVIKKEGFIKRHRVAIAIVGTSMCWIALNRRSARMIDQFLVEHGIDPVEFWTEGGV